MPAILDVVLIAEFTAIITAGMQAIKSHPKVQGSMIPWLSGVAGLGVGVGWYLVNGELVSSDSFLGVDWADMYRGVFNGVAGAVSANAGYNIQKILPIPNVLPTASEMDAQKLKEEVKTQDMIVDAVEAGVPPDRAKEKIGLDQNDPPPEEQLDAIEKAQDGPGVIETPVTSEDPQNG